MSIRIIHGDCRDVLATLSDESVHCVVTSPPYFGLRDYGTADWDGGDPACSHSVGGQVQDNKAPGAITTGQRPGIDASKCRKCGARRIDRQIGLESTPSDYVAELVGVFREVRRVLRRDGTCWLNLGDSYSTHYFTRQGRPRNVTQAHNDWADTELGGRRRANHQSTEHKYLEGMKPKDLIGIPWLVAFALRADGWYLRSDIIWSKPNPMPESVRDRPTRSHEYLFLLSKSATYYYDAEAIKEDGSIPAGTLGAKGSAERAGTPGVNSRPPEYKVYDGTRNKRSVWHVATQPYAESHFAVFPAALIEPAIKAGTSEKGCCAKCGAPWKRVVERKLVNTEGWGKATKDHHVSVQGSDAIARNGQGRAGDPISTTLGWTPPCSCDAGVVPATVLDPFGGAGTTALVADRLQRNAIIIELNPDYAVMAKRRLDADAGMFSATETEAA